MSLQEGSKAPNFKILADNEQEVSLSDYKGKKVILYFYPKDNTPGCTLEAKQFQEFENQINNKNAVVLGVSKDSIKSHQKFKDKYNLNFLLLADINGDLCESYKVWKQKSMFGKSFLGIERTTFLIDEDQKIQRIWHKVRVKDHVQDILKYL